MLRGYHLVCASTVSDNCGVMAEHAELLAQLRREFLVILDNQ